MIKKLVFEGGGVKGAAYGGALQVLEESGILQGVERVAGTSAGAITAALLAVGYTAEEVTKIITETDFNDFTDDSFGVIRDSLRFLTTYGWFKGDQLEEWVGGHIEKATGDAALTFDGLFKKIQGVKQKGKRRFRYLYIVGTNLSRQQAEVFSISCFSKMEIRQAVRISMSSPFYFQSVKYNEDIYCDGGVAWNYPISLFDQETEKGREPDKEVLGFRVDTKKEIDFSGFPEQEINDIFDYTKGLVTFLYETVNRSHLKEMDRKRTVFIDSLDVRATDFDITKKKKKELVKSGRGATSAWVNDNTELVT